MYEVINLAFYSIKKTTSLILYCIYSKSLAYFENLDAQFRLFSFLMRRWCNIRSGPLTTKSISYRMRVEKWKVKPVALSPTNGTK